MSRGQLEFIAQQGLPIKFLIDIGAGLPDYNGLCQEAWLARKLWPTIEIVGFEPQWERWQAMRTAKYPGWLHPYAIGPWGGRKLHQIGEGWNAGFHWEEGKDYRIVQSKPLDIVMEERPDLENALLWADVEGDEVTVLRTAPETLAKTIAVVVETWPESRCEGWCTADEVGVILRSAGFRMVKYFPSGPTDPQRDEVWLR